MTTAFPKRCPAAALNQLQPKEPKAQALQLPLAMVAPAGAPHSRNIKNGYQKWLDYTREL